MVSTGLSFRKASDQISLMIVLFFLEARLRGGFVSVPWRKDTLTAFLPQGKGKRPPPFVCEAPSFGGPFNPPFV